MSGVTGGDLVRAKLRALGQSLPARLREANDQGAREMQEIAVQLVPKRTGKTAALLASDEAVGPLVQKSKGRGRRGGGDTPAEGADYVVFGFRTPELQRAGFKAFWLEFGNKAHAKGESRRAGKDKQGRQRFQKVKRAVPARAAQPFMRPAAILMRERLRQLRNIAWGHAAVDVAKAALLGGDASGVDAAEAGE